MTVHYSRYGLNTYRGMPYFQEQVPADYPQHPVLQKCRAFRRLPPNLRRLSELAKRWAKRHYPDADFNQIDLWYDDDGYELNPDTGERLTDQEIDDEWDRLGDLGLDDFEVEDIPIPPGGFADPDTWEPPAPEPDLVDRSGLTEAQVLSDIASRGRAATAREYGVPQWLLVKMRTESELARTILAMHGQPWSQYEEQSVSIPTLSLAQQLHHAANQARESGDLASERIFRKQAEEADKNG
jgi:hypothetical protein